MPEYQLVHALKLLTDDFLNEMGVSKLVPHLLRMSTRTITCYFALPFMSKPEMIQTVCSH